MKSPIIFTSTLPPLKPPPPNDDHTPEGSFILLFNEAVDFATIHNAAVVAIYVSACSYWQVNAQRYAWNKLPVPPKPTPPVGWIIRDAFIDAYSLRGPRAVEGTELLAGPCPDLEPDGVSTHPTPVDPVGDWFGGWDPWYRVLPGDVTAIGNVVSVGESSVHPAGRYGRRERITPFGGFQYWEKFA